jgi:hypothetical protein
MLAAFVLAIGSGAAYACLGSNCVNDGPTSPPQPASSCEGSICAHPTTKFKAALNRLEQHRRSAERREMLRAFASAQAAKLLRVWQIDGVWRIDEWQIDGVWQIGAKNWPQPPLR